MCIKPFCIILKLYTNKLSNYFVTIALPVDLYWNTTEFMKYIKKLYKKYYEDHEKFSLIKGVFIYFYSYNK